MCMTTKFSSSSSPLTMTESSVVKQKDGKEYYSVFDFSWLSRRPSSPMRQVPCLIQYPVTSSAWYQQVSAASYLVMRLFYLAKKIKLLGSTSFDPAKYLVQQEPMTISAPINKYTRLVLSFKVAWNYLQESFFLAWSQRATDFEKSKPRILASRNKRTLFYLSFSILAFWGAGDSFETGSYWRKRLLAGEIGEGKGMEALKWIG